MELLDAAAVATALPYPPLIDALDEAFRAGATVPARTAHTVGDASGAAGSLLLMPAWRGRSALGVKIVTVFPDNARRQLGAVNATFLLMDGDTGVPQAIIDGDELTVRRTACASALASRYLSREDASTLLMVGNGRLAPHLIAAHSAVRPLRRIRVWGRNDRHVAKLVGELASSYSDIRAVNDLSSAVEEADIVSCATLAREPLVLGDNLRPGQHVDLVGAFTAEMAEADAEAMRRARLFVDTYEGAFAEAGDILQAIEAGAITKQNVIADLSTLARGETAGRQSEEEITVFKSVGTALEDLVAAQQVVAARRG